MLVADVARAGTGVGVLTTRVTARGTVLDDLRGATGAGGVVRAAAVATVVVFARFVGRATVDDDFEADVVIAVRPLSGLVVVGVVVGVCLVASCCS